MKKKEFLKELQDTLHKKTGNKPTLKETREVLDSVVETMEYALSQGKTFHFKNFGRFEFRPREGFKRRTYVKSGEKVPGGYITQVDPHVIAYFRPSKKLNEKLTKRLVPILFDDVEEDS